MPYWDKNDLNRFLSIPLHLMTREEWGDDPDVQELANEIRSGEADWLLNPQAFNMADDDGEDG